jgi:hypothetical protein
MKNMKFLCAVALAAATSLSASPAKVEILKKEFAGVRALELPSHAATTVATAKKADRPELAPDVVRAALDVNASSASLVVGAIARSTPEVAAASAVTAASLQPKQLLAITRAAVGAAPRQAGGIVGELTKQRPAAFAAIGISAVDVAPKSAEAVLNGITKANPTLKALISRVNTKDAKTAPAVVTVLKRTEAMLTKLSTATKTTPETILANELSPAMLAQLPGVTATVMAAPPVIGPPYTPGGSFGEFDTSQTYVAPPIPRDYSGP